MTRSTVILEGADDMLIREFRIGDELALHAVFHSAVHHLARDRYTPEQLDAWTPAAIDAGCTR